MTWLSKHGRPPIVRTEHAGSEKEQARRKEAARIKRLKRAGRGKIYGKSIVEECRESTEQIDDLFDRSDWPPRIELVNDIDPYRDAMQDAGRGRLLP